MLIYDATYILLPKLKRLRSTSPTLAVYIKTVLANITLMQAMWLSLLGVLIQPNSTLYCSTYLNGTASNRLNKGPFINYVTLQKGGRGGISQCDDVYIKHTSVWDNV